MTEKEMQDGLRDHAQQERDRFLAECNRDIAAALAAGGCCESDRARGDRLLWVIRSALHLMIDGNNQRAFDTLRNALPENKRRTK